MTSNTSGSPDGRRVPNALDEPGHTAAHGEAPSDPPLTLSVRGFSKMERQLLNGTVKLSQRRNPRLELLDDADVRRADVILIDGLDIVSVQWAQAQPWLSHRTVIWVDSKVPRPGHMLSKRPVQWPILPMLLARALESSSAARGSPSGFVPFLEAAQPVARATASAAPATPPAAEVAPTTTTTRQVLIVDDSLAVRQHLRSLLEARGYGITEAASAADALEAVKQKHFDCALMDVLMPDMDGYEGCRRLKAMRALIGQLPVVMLTSKSSPFDRIRGKMSGCDAYLTKPVEPLQLYEVLSQQFTGARAGATTPVSTPATLRSPHGQDHPDRRRQPERA